jgi:hypothetical protein
MTKQATIKTMINPLGFARDVINMMISKNAKNKAIGIKQ